MEPQFTNHEISIEDLPQYQAVNFHPISIKERSKSLVQASVFTLVFIVGCLVLLYFVPFNWFIGGAIALVLFYIVVGYVDTFLKQPYYGYALREHDVVYRRGYITRKVTAMPFNRIQHVAVTESFLDKVFGIASLKIYTAGGSGGDINIPGLKPEAAERLRDTISEKVFTHEN